MKCFRIIDNTDDVQQLQSDLSNLNDWSANHFMEFNSKKCKYLAITRKKNIVDSAYTLNGSQIMSVLTEKDLGVHVSTPGGALPYLGYTGTCRWIGYGFLASLS